MLCPNCGREIPGSARFCNHCGKPTKSQGKRHTRRTFLILSITVVVLALVVYLAMGVRKADRIAYVRIDEDLEHSVIWIMNADGTEQTALTDVMLTDVMLTWPEWSPDGKRIAFVALDSIRYASPRGSLYIMDAGGGNQRRLTDLALPDYYSEYWMYSHRSHSWSPDGREIVVSDERGLSVVDVRDGNVTRIVRIPSDRFAVDPSWSPDGGRIAYMEGSEDDDVSAIRVINRDGTGRIELPRRGLDMSLWPEWSPDGKTIAYTGVSEEDDVAIYLSSPDGFGHKKLIGDDFFEPGFAVWSPDGKKIAFVRRNEGTWYDDPCHMGLYVMTVDGRSLSRIADVCGFVEIASRLSWSSDSRRIAFITEATDPVADDLEGVRIAVANVDGSGVQYLTEWDAFCIQPAWRP